MFSVRQRSVVLSGLLALAVLPVTHSRPVVESRPLWLFYDTARTTVDHVALRIESAGGRVRYRSHWLPVVSAHISATQARRIRGVNQVQPVGYLVAQTAGAPVRRTAQQDSAGYGPNFGALRELGVPQAHTLGFTGRGIRIAILDTGFDPQHEVFALARAEGRIIAQRDFINGDDDVTTQPGDRPAARNQEIHGTWVWSVLAGYRAGQVVGPAHGAQFILAKVDVENTGEHEAADEDRWVEAFEWAQAQGAQIINSSLAFKAFADRPGYRPEDMNGNVAVSSRIARQAAQRGIVLVNAVGNTQPPLIAPPGSVFAPADADGILAVGAIDNLGRVWDQSARGATADLRTKPELVARGVDLWAANALTADGYEAVTPSTSMAAPLIAGAAALFREAWPNLTASAVRAALLQSGSNADFPDNARGWGLPNVASAIMFPAGFEIAGVETVDLNNTLQTVSPVFTWRATSVHPLTQPRYRLELAADPQFNTIFYTDSVGPNARQLALRQPLRPRNAFWWRVVAEEPTSGIRSLTPVRAPLSMPSWVTLTTLNDAQPQFINTTRPRFSWQPLSAQPPIGPLVFDLQVLSGANGQVVQNLRNLTTADVQLTDPLVPNQSYRWRVIARSQVGVADTATSRDVFVVQSTSQPPTTMLFPPFPNPFPRGAETETRFWFDLAESTSVELTIHDLRGRLVRRLIPATSGCQALASGQYGRASTQESPCVSTAWNGRNQAGELMPAGIYIARLRTRSAVSTQRILFVPNQ